MVTESRIPIEVRSGASATSSVLGVLFMALVIGPSCSRSHSEDVSRERTLERPSDIRPGQAAPKVIRPGPAELLTTMATLAGESPSPDTILDWVSYLERKDQTIDDYIEFILSGPRFGRTVVPSLLFGSFVNMRNYYAYPSGFNLQSTKDGVLYLREPCAKDKAVKVAPWWDLGNPVLVCEDSYQPERWTMAPDEHEYRSKMRLTCDSQVGSPEKELQPLCGCGPNLIRCLKSGASYLQSLDSIRDEVRDTTAYVVDKNLPMSSLFTMNETVRDRHVEAHYRRRMIGASRDADVSKAMKGLTNWPQEGQLAPRREVAPGQHAGLLTGPQLLHLLPDRRQRQRGFYEIMWCTNRSSFGATTEQVLSLNESGNLAFVHDSWERLAKTPLCTNCHARLDYGFQFFLGYPDSRASIHYVPDIARSGDGALYGEDIGDPRGEAQLTPLGFAKLAVAQPEFTSCMSQHFINYVLGERATPDDIRAIREEVTSNQNFKSAMRVALQLYAKRWNATKESDRKPVDVPAESASDGAHVNIAGDLRMMIDEHCGDCHASEDRKFIDSSQSFGQAFDFQSPRLPRALVVRMADHVAFGKMPKDADDFTRSDRERVVELLIAALWPRGDKRTAAREYYVGQMHALPAQNIDNAMDMVVFRAGGNRPRQDWGLFERTLYADHSFMTPGYSAQLGLEALSACRSSGNHETARLRTCLRRALDIDTMIRWPLEDPLP